MAGPRPSVPRTARRGELFLGFMALLFVAAIAVLGSRLWLWFLRRRTLDARIAQLRLQGAVGA